MPKREQLTDDNETAQSSAPVAPKKRTRRTKEQILADSIRAELPPDVLKNEKLLSERVKSLIGVELDAQWLDIIHTARQAGVTVVAEIKINPTANLFSVSLDYYKRVTVSKEVPIDTGERELL